MKGLLYKDICILRQRKSSFAVFIALLLFFSFSNGIEFTVAYGTILFGILALGTIAYDDDNCLMFLMTLPVTIRDYVKEKFILCGAGLFLGWFISVILNFVISVIRGTFYYTSSDFAALVVTLFVLSALTSLYIPVQLKYGLEKSRIVMLAFGALVVAVIMLLGKLNVHIPEGFSTSLSATVLLPFLIILVSGIAVISFSFLWSVRVLEKKTL